MTQIRRSFAENAVPFAGLAVCLAALLVTEVADLDHGFHVAQGNWILAHGLPERQILVPALADRPWTSIYPLGSVALAVAWNLAGPAGLVVLKVLGYGGAFLLSAAAAVRRGAAPWIACLLAGLAAAAMPNRFVERPTLFSELLLGLVVWFFAKPGVGERIERAPSRHAAAFACVSTLWCVTHAGWNIGLAAAAMLTLATVRRWNVRILLGASAIAVPYLLVSAFHPGGWKALAGPISIVAGRGAKFDIAEHSLAAWQQMPFASLVWMASFAAAIAFARRRRFAEAGLLGILMAGNLAFPRFVLPLAIAALPLGCELLASIPRIARDVEARTLWLSSALTAMAGIAAVVMIPWRSSGTGIDPSLDTRGVGTAMESFDGSEGPVLSTFGWSSLLLSNASVARQGVVMDGRIEEYDHAHFEDVYAPALDPGSGWAEAVARTGAAVYCEPWPGRRGAPQIASQFRQKLGWQLIAWDNSSRLFARPDVVERLGLPVLQCDPATLDDTIRDIDLAGAEMELRRVVSRLEERGFPSARGRIAVARLSAAAGRLDDAQECLAVAADQGGTRFVMWWAVRGSIAMADGDTQTARMCAERIRKLGSGDLADKMEAALDGGRPRN